MTTVLLESFRSILVAGFSPTGTFLSSATAFLVSRGHELFLITNRHVVTGLNQTGGTILSTTGAVPSKLRVMLPMREELQISWELGLTLDLYDEQYHNLWFEHPTLGPRADIVALRLPPRPRSVELAYDVLSPINLVLAPAETVSVVGFPFGVTSGGGIGNAERGVFAVWATGFVASEPGVDYDGLPVFLIDCRSRPGQSGSPVLYTRQGGTVTRPSGTVEMHVGRVTEFLGIYSGRINTDSDIGMVWKKSAINELVAAVPPAPI
jgi:hypothetical protein